MFRSFQRIPQRIINFFTYGFDNIISGSALKQLVALIFISVLIYAVAFLVWIGLFPSELVCKDRSEIWWVLLNHMIDPGNLPVVGKETVDKGIIVWHLRLFAFLLTFLGTIVYGGLLISTFSNIFESRVNLIREGLTSYSYKNHFVILGFCNVAEGIIVQLIGKYPAADIKIVVLTEGNVQSVKNRLFSILTSSQLKRIYVLHGNRTSTKDLNRACITNAREVFMPGEENEPDHDSKSNNCINLIEMLVRKQRINAKSRKTKQESNQPAIPKKKIICNVLFNSQTTHAAYQYLDICREHVEINSLSFYDEWARMVFISCQASCENNTMIHKHIRKASTTPATNKTPMPRVFKYQPLDFEPITPDSDKYVHLIVAGMSRMGHALGVQAARLAHYANFQKCKTRITFIDDEIDRNRDFFASRYQSFWDAVDVKYTDVITGQSWIKEGKLPFINTELHFVKGRFESLEIRNMLLDLTNDNNALTTLAICFNDPATCLAAGLYLPEEIYSRNVNILIHQSSENSILASLAHNDKKVLDKYERVKIYGMQNKGLDLSLNNKFKAMAVNYFYYSPTFTLPNSFSEIELVKMKKDWVSLKERFKWSNRNNAESFPTKIRALQSLQPDTPKLEDLLTPENVEMLARLEHARWNADALLAGFYPAPEEVRKESTRTADLVWEALKANEGNFENEDVAELKAKHEGFVKPLKQKMIHPCIVPFDELSEYYKEIDRRLVRSMALIEAENKRLFSLDWNQIK